MTHDSAKLLCNAMGGFMAEVPYGPHLNNWIVNKLLEKYEKAVQEAGKKTRLVLTESINDLSFRFNIIQKWYFPSLVKNLNCRNNVKL